MTMDKDNKPEVGSEADIYLWGLEQTQAECARLTAEVDRLNGQIVKDRAIGSIETERLHGLVDKLEKLYKRAEDEVDDLTTERDKLATQWQINKRKLTAERDRLRGVLEKIANAHFKKPGIGFDALKSTARAALTETKGDDNNAK